MHPLVEGQIRSWALDVNRKLPLDIPLGRVGENKPMKGKRTQEATSCQKSSQQSCKQFGRLRQLSQER